MEYFDFLDATIQPRLLVDDEYAFAFLSYMPIVAGHTLICPKRAVSRFDQLKDVELQSIIHLKDILHIALTRAFEAEGFNYAWNEWKVAWQTVDHFHLHMLPRKVGDTGIYEYEPRNFLYRSGERPISLDKELQTTAQHIKSYL